MIKMIILFVLAVMITAGLIKTAKYLNFQQWKSISNTLLLIGFSSAIVLLLGVLIVLLF